MSQKKKNLKAEFALLACAALALASVPGCSLFGSRLEGGPENAAFRSQASMNSNPIPLPVEIVNDITTIASGGSLQQEGVWRPTYPDAPVAPAAPVVQLQPAGNPEPVEEAAQNVTVGEDGVVVESVAAKPVSDTADTSVTSPSTGKSRRRIAGVGKTETYKVRSGDTLMKISFEKFGNIYRWREIYETNKSKIPNFNSLTAGTLLTIQGVEYIVIRKNGQPYLIRRGDTLVKISNNVYNTPTEWKGIWKNNPQLIKDPNKIYAGFTLYYVPKTRTEKPMPVKQISADKKQPTRLPAKELSRKIAPVTVPSVTAPTSVPKAAIVTPPEAQWTPSPAMTPTIQ